MQKYDVGLVSLILPIYNVEKYLPKCIEACISQTYSNIEIILVDDGGHDNCPKICDEYALKDSRIKVMHKENGGLSDARNAGIRAANGEWIAFVDSDDLISNNYVKYMLDAAVNHNCPMVWCRILEVDENDNPCDGKDVKECPYDSYEYKLFTKQEAEMQFYTMWGMQLALVAWNKLYHKSLFKNEDGEDIFYAVGKIFEDGYTTYKYIYQAEKTVYIDAPLYYYRQRSGSIMKENRLININHAMEAGVERMEFYKKHSEQELYRAELNYSIYWPVRAYDKITDKEKKKELIRWFKHIYYDYFVKEKWPVAKKIRMWAFLKCRPLYKLLSLFNGVYNSISKR